MRKDCDTVKRKNNNDITVNEISPPAHIESLSNGPVGNETKNPACIYAHKKHAVGSKLKNRDGSVTVCTEDGTWQN